MIAPPLKKVDFTLYGSFAKEKRTFEIKDGHFYVNGKVTPILSGEMHYPRIPHQYWRHRFG